MKKSLRCPKCDVPLKPPEASGIYVCVMCGWEGTSGHVPSVGSLVAEWMEALQAEVDRLRAENAELKVEVSRACKCCSGPGVGCMTGCKCNP